MADELDYAQEAIKQVLTLCTGVLALSLTFAKEFTASVPERQRWPLYCSWSLLSATVLVSIWALLAITGERHEGHTDSKACNIRLPWLIQLGFFVGGFAFMVGYAVGHLPP